MVGTAVTFGCAAISAAGWRHPLLIKGLWAFAAVLLAAGLGWPAVKAIFPAATGMIQIIASSPIAWFCVLILGLTASLLRPLKLERTPSVGSDTTALQRQNEPAIPIEPIKKAEEQKIFIHVKPSYLIGLYKNNTQMHGDELSAAYIGKWMQVSGKVFNASRLTSEQIIIYIKDDDGAMIGVKLLQQWAERAGGAKTGEIMSFKGKIEGVSGMMVNLHIAEIVDT